MNCKDFHYWMTTRDIHDDSLPALVRDHIAICPECRTLLEQDTILDQGIAAAFTPEDLPRGMQDRISISLGHDRQNFFTRFTGKHRSFAGASLAAAMIIVTLFFINFNSPTPAFKDLNQITRQAVTDHLKGNRHISFDAQKTEQALATMTQTLGFKVMLPDLDQMGYTLIGGRLCALGDCRAAYFVVEHDGKTGSLFIMDTDYIKFSMTDGSRFTTSVKGCDTCVWKDHGQVYAMVF